MKYSKFTFELNRLHRTSCLFSLRLCRGLNDLSWTVNVRKQLSSLNCDPANKKISSFDV